MPFNLPILLTWLRIVAIQLLIAVYYLPADWASGHERDVVATYIFLAAAFTDWADGFLARKLNQTSAFGAFLDPVADKLMVAAALLSRCSARSRRRHKCLRFPCFFTMRRSSEPIPAFWATG